MKKAYIHCRLPFTNHNAFIVENGRFTHVGIASNILNIEVDEVIDLNDNVVLPGFNDAHMHVLGLGYMLSIHGLSAFASIEEMIQSLKKDDRPIIEGRGFTEGQFKEKRLPTKDDLNRIAPDRPVLLYRVCGHLLVANDKAMEQAIEAQGQPPFKDEVDLTLGHFKETAIGWLKEAFDLKDESILEKEILLAQEHLLSHGVTSVGSDDFIVYAKPYEEVLKVLARLGEAGTLTLRVQEQANLPKLEDFQDFLKKGYAKKRFGRYVMGPSKLLVDGSLGASSAYMLEPYTDDPSQKGLLNFDQSMLETYIRLCHEHAMDFSWHAIGDGTSHVIMEALEAASDENTRKQRRHSLIHAQLTPLSQIKRMQALHLGSIPQPIFIDEDIDILERRIGERRFDAYRFKSLYHHVPTALSTDAPIETVNPFRNLYLAVTRQSLKHPEHPPYLLEEAMTLKDALHSYTVMGAYFMYQEHELGQIKPGFLADFVVVEGFDERHPSSLLKTQVLKTFIEGECVFNRSK